MGNDLWRKIRSNYQKRRNLPLWEGRVPAEGLDARGRRLVS